MAKTNDMNTPTKVPCGGFVLGEGLALGEDGKTLNVTGGAVVRLTGIRMMPRRRIISRTDRVDIQKPPPGMKSRGMVPLGIRSWLTKVKHSLLKCLTEYSRWKN